MQSDYQNLLLVKLSDCCGNKNWKLKNMEYSWTTKDMLSKIPLTPVWNILQNVYYIHIHGHYIYIYIYIWHKLVEI